MNKFIAMLLTVARLLRWTPQPELNTIIEAVRDRS